MLLSDMLSPPMSPEDDSGPADPWFFDYLVDYAQVDSEVRTCYAMWGALLREEHPERETQATDLRDGIRRVIQARREIMEILHRDAKRQADTIRALLDVEHSVMDDMPAKQAVGS